MTRWKPIATAPLYRVVLLYRASDLYPVVGWRAEEDLDTGPPKPHFFLEEGGPEDGDHRTMPELAYLPTHWAEIPEVPS